MVSMDLLQSLPSYMLPFFSLSYPTSTPQSPDSFVDSSYYKTGSKDLCFVVTCIAVMALLRDVFRLGVFEPFARWKLSRDLRHNSKRSRQAVSNGGVVPTANGNGSTARKGDAFTKAERQKMHRSVLRFAEQGWSAVYYPLQWGLGVYVHHNLPTRLLDPVDVWVNYPHTTLAAPVKFYYLTQFAFYLHQMLILNAEARRKDHVQMMAHHIITVFLMGMSYFYNLTRIGCLITVLMDWCDIFLPLAKMLRYLALPQIYPDITFGIFMLSWLITRHILFIFVIYSALHDVPRVLPYDWDPARGFYLSQGSFSMFIICLIALEILQMIWGWMIFRVAWRVVVSGAGASDDRSDDEGDDTADKDD